jgi:glutaredoxin 3
MIKISQKISHDYIKVFPDFSNFNYRFQQFQKLNVPFLVIEIENRPDCNEIQDVLNELTGARSVPRVFVNEKFIGGGTDVKKLYENGQLEKMCQ